MNLLPESNGIKAINTKEKLTKFQIFKIVAIVVLLIIGSGIAFQMVNNFIGKEKISSRLLYARVDSKKMEYNLQGSGSYTIVFDGAIGANLYEWNSLFKKIQKEVDVQVFVYNRRGYGFNDGGSARTPSEQAADLKILLRKAGISGNLILVGEEYGSLVMTNFANLYPEIVSAMILVKPLNEDDIKSDDFKKDIRFKYYKSKIEAFGSSFGLTYLLDSLGVAYSLDDFAESLPKGADEEYKVHRTKKNYRQAICNELGNLYKYNDSSQKEGLISGRPLYIISEDENDPLSKLSDVEHTTIYETEIEGNLISINGSDAIFTAIENVLKECKKIDKLK